MAEQVAPATVPGTTGARYRSGLEYWIGLKNCGEAEAVARTAKMTATNFMVIVRVKLAWGLATLE